MIVNGADEFFIEDLILYRFPGKTNFDDMAVGFRASKASKKWRKK